MYTNMRNDVICTTAISIPHRLHDILVSSSFTCVCVFARAIYADDKYGLNKKTN